MARRILFAVFAGAVIAGVVLLLRPLLQESQPLRGGTAAREAVPPVWLADAPRREAFTGSLERIPLGRLNDLRRTRDALRDSLAQFESLTFQGRMARVLAQGDTLRSGLRATVHMDGDDADVDLDVHQASGDSSRFRAELRGGRLADARWVGEDRTFSVDPDLPIGIGDLPVRDLIAFYRVATGDLPRPIGYDDRGAERQLVLEVRIPGRKQPVRDRVGPEEADAWGARALVWARDRDLHIERVRVFNHHDVLIRDYEVSGPWNTPPITLRVRSLPTSSHTTFWIESTETRPLR